MTARRDPVRTTAVLLPALVAAVLVPLLVRAAYQTVTASTQGRVEPTVPRAAQLPTTPATLLVIEDDQGRPAAALLLAPAPAGAGGAAVVLPLGTLTTGAGGQPERLDAGWATQGLDGVAADVEGLLGITLTGRLRVTPAQLADLVRPLTPATIRLPDDVLAVAPDGRELVVAPAGERPLDAAGVAAVLVARGDESELVRVDRALAVWRALLPTAGRTATPAAPAPTVAVAADGGDRVAAVLQTLAAGRTVVRALAVVAAAPPAVDEERFAADVPALRLLVAQIVPGAVSPVDNNVRVRLLNPSGDEGVAYQAVARLLAAGANVVLVDDTAGAVPATSALTYHDPARQTALAALAPAIGSLGLATTDERIDGVDATIALGQDFVTLARHLVGAGSTTTAEPPATTGASPTTTLASAPGAGAPVRSPLTSTTSTTKKNT